MQQKPQDEIKAVASATEWTGALPAVPWDGDTAPLRRLMRVHAQPGKVYHKGKDRRK